MSVTADALADLRFSLHLAAARFEIYSEITGLPANAGLFHSLAVERREDAENLGRIAAQTGLNDGKPTMDANDARAALGMGDGEGVSISETSAASTAYRVQRA